MKSLLLSLLLLFISPFLFAQGGFQKIIGGSNTDKVYSTIETPDGGYMISGITSSYGAGGGDNFLARFDHYGNIIWTKTYGGTSNEELFNTLYLLSDGNYILTSGTTSFGSSGRDAYILKIDDSGNIIWDTRYSVSSNENPRSVLELSNGDILIGGNSNQVISAADMLLIKLTSNGTPVFANNFGVLVNDHICGLKNLADGTVMAFGIFSVVANHDFGLVNMDTNGNIIWQKKYGGSGDDEIWDLEQTDDGGYIAVGTSDSWGNGNFEGCLIKFDSIGNVLWSKSFGGSNEEILREIEILPSGNLMMYGTVKSYGNNNGDLILMKTDPNGNLIWAKTLGGTGIELLEQTDQTFNLTSDNMLIFGASSTSYGSGNQGLFIKSDTTGNMFCNNNITSMVTLYNAPITPVIISVTSTTTGNFSNPTTIINTPTISINNNCLCSPGFAGTVINTDSLSCSEVSFSSNYSGEVTSFLWDFGDGNTSTDYEINHDYLIPGTYTACLSITNACGDDTLICKTVTVSNCPCSNFESLVVSQDTVCLGEQVTALALSGIYSYEWGSGETTSSINFSPLISQTVFLYVNNGICLDTLEEFITVLNPQVSINGPDEICAGETVTYNASGTSNYVWFNSSVSNSIQISLAQSGNVFVIGSENGFCPDTASITVLVHPNVSLDITGDSTVCIGETVELQGISNGSFTWNTGETTTNIFVSPTITEEYFIFSTGFCPDTSFITVSVFQIPEAIISGDTVICEGESVTLNGSGGTSLDWNNGQSSGSTILLFPVNNDIVTLIASNGDCKDTATISFLVHPIVSLDIIGDSTVCIGETVELQAVTNGSFTWNTGETTTSIFVSPTITEEYFIFSTGFCPDTSFINVSVFQIPEAIISGDTMICEGESATLIGSGGTSLDWNNGQGNGSTILLFPEENDIVTLIVSNGDCKDTAQTTIHLFPDPVAGFDFEVFKEDCALTVLVSDTSSENSISWIIGSTNYSSMDEVLHLYSSDEMQVITQIVENSFGCKDSATVFLDESMDGFTTLYVPNSFTPNGDGKNDTFFAKGTCLKLFKMEIFNRWGELLFESDDINEEWDGMHKGLKCQIDVYVYKIYLEGLDDTYENIRGHIALIR